MNKEWDLSGLRSVISQQVKDAMEKVKLGMPIHLAAAKIGLMPSELESIHKLIQREEAEK